ncbi:tryptophan transporter [uncultured Clostridium sp.]|uniref:tryptophan transporter n=1 Tax=uncultured Clostridium sp. TaxID=59620 RepID=UPI002604FA3C|nr:tryptophan transporter [uncultured Clostridium sp.]
MRNQNTKKLVMNALLLGVGAMLHQITPALGLPMQPDFALAMLFIVIIINNGDYKTTLISGIVTGIFTALTTKFPGGQIPNFIDKMVTVHIVFLLVLVLGKVLKDMDEKKKRFIQMVIILPVGTLISGSVFLGSALMIVGLPAPFMALFMTVVLPAIAINLVVGVVLFKVIEKSMRVVATT